jgi:hypothetical protein
MGGNRPLIVKVGGSSWCNGPEIDEVGSIQDPRWPGFHRELWHQGRLGHRDR